MCGANVRADTPSTADERGRVQERGHAVEEHVEHGEVVQRGEAVVVAEQVGVAAQRTEGAHVVVEHGAVAGVDEPRVVGAHQRGGHHDLAVEVAGAGRPRPHGDGPCVVGRRRGEVDDRGAAEGIPGGVEHGLDPRPVEHADHGHGRGGDGRGHGRGLGGTVGDEVVGPAAGAVPDRGGMAGRQEGAGEGPTHGAEAEDRHGRGGRGGGRCHATHCAAALPPRQVPTFR